MTFETLPGTEGFWSRVGIPIHPQPGIFETTVATVKHRWGDSANGGSTTRTFGAREIEHLLAAPRFDWTEALRRSDDQWATRTGKGWRNLDGDHHCFRPVPGQPKKIRSLCGEYRLSLGVSLAYSAAGQSRCGECLHREIVQRATAL